jgi:hypothetical protein
MLPDVAPGAVLRVTKDGEEIWSRNAPAEPPRILDVSAEINRHKPLALQWRVEDPQPDEIEYWVRWSADEGESWHSLRTDITKTEAEFSLEGLPAGQVQLHVVAHDGFFSMVSEPVAVTVPPQPPIITILHPREGDVLAPVGHCVSGQLRPASERSSSRTIFYGSSMAAKPGEVWTYGRLRPMTESTCVH